GPTSQSQSPAGISRALSALNGKDLRVAVSASVSNQPATRTAPSGTAKRRGGRGGSFATARQKSAIAIGVGSARNPTRPARSRRAAGVPGRPLSRFDQLTPPPPTQTRHAPPRRRSKEQEQSPVGRATDDRGAQHDPGAGPESKDGLLPFPLRPLVPGDRSRRVF